MLHTLFSFDGRLSRTGFWEVLASVVLVDVVLTVGLTLAVQHMPEVAAYRAWVRWGLLALAILSIWSVLAAHVKRAHDCGQSAVVLFWVLLPVIGWLWLLYDLGFRAGSFTGNRFGAAPPSHDPHGAGEPAGSSGGHGGLFGLGRKPEPYVMRAELDWTGAASEESTRAVSRDHSHFDAGEALMAASARHDPPPQPAAQSAPAPAPAAAPVQAAVSSPQPAPAAKPEFDPYNAPLGPLQPRQDS